MRRFAAFLLGAAAAPVLCGQAVLADPRFHHEILGPRGGKDADQISVTRDTADSLVGYLPVAGTVVGANGSNFKTSAQVLNPYAFPPSGSLQFHPANLPPAVSDPSVTFSLGPGQSVSWDDLVSAAGGSGLGTVEVYASVAGAPPVVVAHVFDDSGSGGTEGFSETLVLPSETGAMSAHNAGTGFLIAPADVARYRFNIGLRALSLVAVTVTVRDSTGNIVKALSRGYPEGIFEQKSSFEFLDGYALVGGESVELVIAGGPGIVYGATVDNVTNDPSYQLMRYLGSDVLQTSPRE